MKYELDLITEHLDSAFDNAASCASLSRLVLEETDKLDERVSELGSLAVDDLHCFSSSAFTYCNQVTKQMTIAVIYVSV